MASTPSSNRSAIIDNARIVCLFLILFCHIPVATGAFHNWAYSFHVPIFFLISGIFYKKDSLRNTIIKSAKGLLLPYVIFNLLLIGIGISIGFLYSRKISASSLYSLLGILGGSSDDAAPYTMPGGPSWFLIALFVARLLIRPMLTGKYYLRIIYGGILIGIYFLLNHYYSYTIWSVDSAILGTFFMLIGYSCKNIILPLLHIDYKKRLLIIAGLALLIPLAIANGTANMYNGEYGKNFLVFYLCGVSGALIIILLCSFANFTNRLSRLFLSGSTFFICCHIMVMEYIVLLYRKFTHVSRDLMVVDKVIVALASVGILICLMLLMKRFMPKLLK